MPHHNWKDKDFDWNALNSAINYCMGFWKKWGRIGTHGKEKYGTFRDHIYLWDGSIYQLFYPGYVRVKPGFWHFWYFKVDYRFGVYFFKYTKILKAVHWYQSQIYNYAIQKMCKKYPHIIDELVSDLDGYEMVKPGIFGKVDGVLIHKKYWTEFK
ncbi:hypothetical protein EBU95_03930 [bacterium]|nr:hypothetical protein [bacterium]